jgi:hypothetical protein
VKLTLQTRKPIGAVRPSDFDAFPVWEFTIDEEGDDPRMDETWIRPVRAVAVRRDALTQHVASDFLLGSGHSCRGFVTISTSAGEPDIEPGGVLLPKGLYLYLPNIAPRVAMRTKSSWALEPFQNVAREFRIPIERIDPLVFRLRVVIKGEKSLRFGLAYPY